MTKSTKKLTLAAAVGALVVITSVGAVSGGGAPMAYSYVEMPLGKVTSEVGDAMTAIDAGETDAAVAHLRAIADALVAETVTIGAVETGMEPGAESATDADGAKG